MAQPVGINIRAEVRGLLALILGRPVGDTENPSRADDPGWDSLKHIEMVFLLEDHFQLRFTPEDIAEFRDADGIARLLEARLAA